MKFLKPVLSCLQSVKQNHECWCFRDWKSQKGLSSQVPMKLLLDLWSSEWDDALKMCFSEEMTAVSAFLQRTKTSESVLLPTFRQPKKLLQLSELKVKRIKYSAQPFKKVFHRKTIFPLSGGFCRDLLLPSFTLGIDIHSFRECWATLRLLRCLLLYAPSYF